MISNTDLLLALYQLSGAMTPERMRVITVTLAWVRLSCERDGHPRWLVDMVEQRVRAALLADDFPLAVWE